MDPTLLTLLTDLVAPNDFPASSFPLLAHAVGNLRDPSLEHLMRALMSSTCLWDCHQPSTSSESLAHKLSFPRSRDIFAAVQYGIAYRVNATEKAYGSGWMARRRLLKTLKAIMSIVENGDTAHYLGKVLLASAILRGLQDAVLQGNKLKDLTSWSIEMAEEITVRIWVREVGVLDQAYTRLDPLRDDDAVPAYLMAQILPDIPSEKLNPLLSEPFLGIAFSILRKAFYEGGLLERGSTGETSIERLRKLDASLLHRQLGRYSRALGKIIESDSSEVALQAILRQLKVLERDIHQIADQYITTKSPMQDSTDDSSKSPWPTLKTLLFSTTVIYTSLIALLNAVPLSPRTSPPATLVDLAQCALSTFSSLYFVTSKLGTEGYSSYQATWHGSLDIILRATPARIEDTARALQPRQAGNDEVMDARTTYYLNAMEQLIPRLPDPYLETELIPLVQLYAQEKSHQEPFEAAHSVILAIFTNQRNASLLIANWYCELLLQAYPDLLSISQLRLAFSTMMSAVSDLDPRLAKTLLDKLCEKLASIPTVSVVREVPAQDHVSGTSFEVKDEGQQLSNNTALSETYTETSKPSPQSSLIIPDAIESDALNSQRGHLLLVLIDQASSVTSELLEYCTDRISWFLGEEEEALPSPMDSRKAISDTLFNTIATKMDATNREKATKWFLEFRKDLQGEEERRAKL